MQHATTDWPPSDAQRLRAVAPALALLALAILINYVDRGILSIAAPLLERELGLSATRLGILFSAFFYTYTLFVFLSGWLVDRYDVNRVLAAGFAVWTLATAATGLAEGFAVLLLCRLLLGAGESVAFPSASKIIAAHVPTTHIGLANGIITAGIKIGPAAGSLGAGLLIARYGWRPVFVAIGIGCAAWIPAWLKWMPGKDWAGQPSAGCSIAAGDILGKRSFWGCASGHFCYNYLSYFLVTWLPLYLVKERQLSLRGMSKITAAYFALDALSAFSTGWLADAWVRRGASQSLARKSAMLAGHMTAAAGLLACIFTGPATYLGALAVVALGAGMSGAGVFAFAQILAGQRAAGRWAGLQNGFGNFAGMIGPALAGVLVERTGSFSAALVVTATVSLLGALSWTLFVGRVEKIAWRGEDQPAGPAAPGGNAALPPESAVR
jgi:ACS family D-galactonate transporter-like MFS transporter